MDNFLIQQRKNDECMVASLAMIGLAGIIPETYETLLKDFHEGHMNGGLTPEDVLCEYNVEYDIVTPYDDIVLAEGRLYLLIVPSLNSLGGLHTIVVKDGKVYDPAAFGMRYTLEEGAEPGFVTLRSWCFGYEILREVE